MSASENAEAILIVIKRILKWCAIGILVLIAIGILVFAYLEVSDWYSKGRHKAKVKVVAEFNNPKCSATYPLYIGVINDSSKTITNISVYLKVTKEGYSKALNRVYSSFDSDFIIKPNVGASACWGVYSDDYSNPKLLDGKGMQVEVDHFYVTFKGE